MESLNGAVDVAATGIEIFAVGVIVVGFILATIRFVVQVREKIDAAYTNYRIMLGRSMLLGLEFLVAGDVVRTVALAPTLSNLAILGVLILVRTFLSWSLVVEMENRWPWQAARE
jgi:uncharacterized membrane protein